MVACDRQLMPDLPDKGRPSSPLTVEDADRLADGFTAFWEDAGAPVSAEPATATPAPAPTAGPGAVTARMPAVQPVPARKPIGKQTLVGIAPINIEKPAPIGPVQTLTASQPVQTLTASQPVQTLAGSESAQKLASSEPVRALTSSEPVQALAGSESAQKLASSEAVQALAATEPIKKSAVPEPAPKPPPSEPIQSSPDVPGYAIAYTPKDHPSTPAVVIAPEAQSAPEHQAPAKRREFSKTVPSHVRSAPTASIAPVLPPVAGDDFDPYLPKKGKGKVLALSLAGVLLLLGSVVGVRSFSRDNHESSAQTVPRMDVMPAATAVAAAPTPAPTEGALTAQPPTSPAAAKESGAVPVASRQASENAPTKPKPKAKAKAEPVVVRTRPITRAPTPEPSPSPTRPASKGVIVRDAPF